MKSRWVRVISWVGRAPSVGDRLRSRRGRYLITEIDFEEELQPGRETLRPKRLRVIRVDTGTVEGGREHPWSWERRGRHRGTPPALPPGHDTGTGG